MNSRLSLLFFLTIVQRSIYMDSFESTIYKRYNMGKTVNNVPYNGSFVFKNEVVATDIPSCSKVGWRMLKAGGTAVDAAIASLLCLGVQNPHSSGIGGGGFMLVHFSTRNISELIDFREQAPACAGPHMVSNQDEIYSGGLSVAVPGELKGMEVAWKKFGKLNWKKLFQPAISMAENGYKVGPALGIAIDKWKTDIMSEQTLKLFKISAVIGYDKKFRELFTINGKIAREGQTLKNKKLAKLLKNIANTNSTDTFYFGDVAKNIEEEIKAFDGCLNEADVSNYQVKTREPLRMPLNEYEVLTGSAPTSGPILALMLKIFQKSNITRKDLLKNAPLVYHTMIEAMKHGYGMRTLLADPDFEPSVDEVIDNIMDSDLADRLYKNVGYKTHGVNHYLVNGSIPFKTGTTHVVVLDKWGNCVSVTSTINGYFGAKFSSKKYGFVYNNEMDDFSFPGMINEYHLPPAAVNYPSKGKRPQSSALPVIILDSANHVVFSAGGSGGSMITSAVLQVLINHVILGMSLKDAMDSPRLHNQVTPNIVYAEPRFPDNILVELTRFSHKTEKNAIHHAVVQAVSRKNGTDFLNYVSRRKIVHQVETHIYAESDYRKGGRPYGE